MDIPIILIMALMVGFIYLATHKEVKRGYIPTTHELTTRLNKYKSDYFPNAIAIKSYKGYKVKDKILITSKINCDIVSEELVTIIGLYPTRMVTVKPTGLGMSTISSYKFTSRVGDCSNAGNHIEWDKA